MDDRDDELRVLKTLEKVFEDIEDHRKKGMELWKTLKEERRMEIKVGRTPICHW